MDKKKLSFTVWNVVKPIYWTLRFFGLAIYSIDGDVITGEIRTNFWDFFQLIFVLCLQFYVLYINLTIDLSLSRTNNLLIDQGAHGIEIFNAVNVLMGTVIYAYYRKTVWRIFQKCNEFDVEMLQYGFDANENTKRRFQATCALTAMLYLIILTSTVFAYDKLFSAETQFYFVFAFVVSNTYTTLFLVGFCMIIYAVCRRYRVINECIKKFFKTEEEDSESDFDKEVIDRESLIIKLADLHDCLNDIVVDINQCCAFEIMMCFASAFLFNIFSTFTLYRIFVRQSYDFIIEAMAQSAWNLYFYMYCFMTIALSSMLTRTGKYSAVLCHKAINYSEDDSIVDHFKLFSQQLRHRSPVVSCGLFTFDYTLLFTLLGATATYIVILIQFDSTPSIKQQLSSDIFNQTN